MEHDRTLSQIRIDENLRVYVAWVVAGAIAVLALLLRFYRLAMAREAEARRRIEHLAHFEGGLGGLEREERFYERASRRDKHERGGDLDDRENSQFAIRDASNASASAREGESLGASRGWQARNECQQQGGQHGQSCSHPEHAGIHGEVEGTHGTMVQPAIALAIAFFQQHR